ncbi:hypothetical protein MSG28_011810 [Choristoneura fumiferana]|uniref:Uncharacterized protein n=1 Tax=Choristoneura fumiferana TaxID=7141 RepID=A0ACC0KMW5_CHOFU|nr:hypothetical protein MSG28_011810 [Choristoneura fumiferana]
MQLKSIAVSLLLLASCEALRILVVFPMASKSHSILGHGVNIVGKPNVDSTFFFDLAFDFHKLFLEDKNVVEFLGNPKEKFDAVIIEWFFSDVVAGLISYPKEKELYKNYFPRIADKRGVTMPSYETAVYNGSLLLLNSHPTIRTPHSLPQSAKYGVIYFSMGSNLKSSDMSEEMKRRILYIFSTFKQRIFWKFEAHPTLRLFITHGGQLSTTEAIHYGVPVIGVPVLADQHLNMDTVIQKGLGLKRARELSEIYHHRPISPRKEIVHWVEHVVKTQGAPHLRSPSLMMPWYQKMYIDLITIVCSLLILSLNLINRIRYYYSIRHKVTFITAFPLKENLPKNYREIDVSSNAQAFMENPQLVNDIRYLQDSAYKVAKYTFDNIDVQTLLNDPKEHFDVVIVDLYETELYAAAETMPKEKAVYKRIFEPLFESRGQSLPNYDDILYNASLVLANDFRGNGLMPSTPQNFHFIGGFHIELPLKKISNDIQTILDNAQHGFIYFSMGSLWQSKDLPKSIINGLLKVFGELKQTVIWKFEEVLPNLPKNVHILKWAPQTSILAHPKCLFFITHGGHLSSIESVHFGVPTIGVPIFFDQFININKAVNNGYAIKVDLNLDLPTNLKTAINKMLTSTTYKEKAKELSFIYHNRPLPPGKELVHWVEHVVRTGGAPHLRSPALMLPWYQKMYLDLCAIILCISAIVLVTLIRLCTSKKVKLDKKQN